MKKWAALLSANGWNLVRYNETGGYWMQVSTFDDRRELELVLHKLNTAS